MSTDKRFFHIPADDLTSIVINWRFERDDNIVREQFVVDYSVPDICGAQRVREVGLGRICHGKHQRNNANLFIEAIYQFNVFDVIVDELLKVMLVQRVKRTILFIG